VVVKPNFLSRDPGIGSGDGNYALFVGRICEEKGIRTLLEAWRGLAPSFELRIIGDGPLADLVRDEATSTASINWLGQRNHELVMQELKSATLLICPSLYHEGGPLTIIEALGCGTPVIASNLDSMNEFFSDGVHGFRFTPGDPDALRVTIQSALADPHRLQSMRHEARVRYEQNYTAERNYELLIRIYESAIHSKNQA
jgi:glycosyltransferase involved in cell wall biosynthesis